MTNRDVLAADDVDDSDDNEKANLGDAFKNAAKSSNSILADGIEEIRPSKAKFDKFAEDVKRRELRGTNLVLPGMVVDRECTLEEKVHVYMDYSCELILKDIAFSANSTDKVIKL